ncbi:RNA 3'-terminal phosphate cyclase-like protein [Osmerus mordax]|uniref:RNA 3'-terminal phosphate cyclase-like protein n=1 Tax=Osmerus mordax TaxID=8014 RepID=UPI0035109BB3
MTCRSLSYSSRLKHVYPHEGTFRNNNNSMASHGLTYDGCNFFRQRLVLSTLSGKRVKIRNIRSKDDNPGLRDFEASFIRLLDKVTNGTRIEINQTGTMLFYQPGLLYGGTIEHECNTQRSIGFYLEALLMLAPFMKNPLRATLKGVTNDPVDPSVDLLKSTAIPLMKQFGVDGEGLELKVVKRGVAPGGGGEVLFRCPVRRTIRPVQLTDPGKIKRIRGIAYSVRVSPQMANRIVDSARSILNKFIPDIYIYTDHMKGANSGKSPGFGLTLVAETLTGSFLSAEMSSIPQGQGDPVLPEDLGRNCAKLLLEEIYRGGCVDSANQSLALLYMTLGQQDVSKALLGPLSPYTIEFLRHVRDFFQIMFKIETQKPLDDERKGGDKVLMTCVGAGYANISKSIK